MIAEDLMNFLGNEGFGTVNTNLFLAFMPDSPNNCLIVRDMPAPNLSESDSLSVDMYTVQIITRNENYITARDLLQSIHKRIVGFGGESLVVGGDIVSYITINTQPTSIGKDEKGRNEWSGHYNLRVQSTNDTYRL